MRSVFADDRPIFQPLQYRRISKNMRTYKEYLGMENSILYKMRLVSKDNFRYREKILPKRYWIQTLRGSMPNLLDFGKTKPKTNHPQMEDWRKSLDLRLQNHNNNPQGVLHNYFSSAPSSPSSEATRLQFWELWWASMIGKMDCMFERYLNTKFWLSYHWHYVFFFNFSLAFSKYCILLLTYKISAMLLA